MMTNTTSMPDPMSIWTAEAVAAIARAPGIGPQRARLVRIAFDSPGAVLAATAERIARRCPGIDLERAVTIRGAISVYVQTAADEAYRRATAGGSHVPSGGERDA